MEATETYNEYLDFDYDTVEIEIFGNTEEDPNQQMQNVANSEPFILTQSGCGASCFYGCSLSPQAQQRIRDYFWKLTAQQKVEFVEKLLTQKPHDHISKNAESAFESFRFHLPSPQGVREVCKNFFLAILRISAQHFSNYAKQRKKKALSRHRLTAKSLNEIKIHLFSTFRGDELNANNTYKIYKTNSKNPVNFEIYEHFFYKFRERFSALKVETVLLEEAYYMESLKPNEFDFNFEGIFKIDNLNDNSIGNRVFESDNNDKTEIFAEVTDDCNSNSFRNATENSAETEAACKRIAHGANCWFDCTTKFSNKLQHKILHNFLKASKESKKQFLKNYIEKIEIRKRSVKCRDQANPRRKNTFRYFLPLLGNKVRVCKSFFFETLHITDAAITAYCSEINCNKSSELTKAKDALQRLRKARILEVQTHIKSFPSDHNLFLSEMYKFYREIAKQPVSIDTYRKHEKIINSGGQLKMIVNREPTFNAALNKKDSHLNRIKTVDKNEPHNSQNQEISGRARKIKERRGNPELWQQNLRIKLRQKGLSYVDRNGVYVPGKTVGPACASNCSFLCTKHFSSEERQRVHSDFWELTPKQKCDFYLSYVKVSPIKNGTTACKNQINPKRKRRFLYFLPLSGKSIRVCKFYFSKTLAVSDAKIHSFFDKRLKNEPLRGRGRKSFTENQLVVAKNHIESCFAAKNIGALTVLQMYNSYKTTTDNPVGVGVYRRIVKTLKNNVNK